MYRKSLTNAILRIKKKCEMGQIIVLRWVYVSCIVHEREKENVMIRWVVDTIVTMLWQMTIVAVALSISFGVGAGMVWFGYGRYAVWVSVGVMIWLGGVIVGLAKNSNGAD